MHLIDNGYNPTFKHKKKKQSVSGSALCRHAAILFNTINTCYNQWKRRIGDTWLCAGVSAEVRNHVTLKLDGFDLNYVTVNVCVWVESCL